MCSSSSCWNLIWEWALAMRNEWTGMSKLRSWQLFLKGDFHWLCLCFGDELTAMSVNGHHDRLLVFLFKSSRILCRGLWEFRWYWTFFSWTISCGHLQILGSSLRHESYSKICDIFYCYVEIWLKIVYDINIIVFLLFLIFFNKMCLS